MKRLGRRSRPLGQTGCDEDLLDDEIKKQLLAGAGIPCDVLEEMSVEERRGTLKAILESNPALLPTLTTDRHKTGVETRTRRSRSTRCKHTGAENEAEKVNGAGAEGHIDRVDSSDSLCTHSSESSLCSTGSDCPVLLQPGRQLRLRSPVCKSFHSSPSLLRHRVQVPQMMAVDRAMDEVLPPATFLKKPAELVLDSDEEKVDEEAETQPYDPGYLVASSEVSLLSAGQELLMEDTIPETQTVESNSETVDSNSETNSEDELEEVPQIVKPVESSRTPETVGAASTSLRVPLPVGVEHDVPLTRLYRTHQNQEKTFWPSLYAPSSVQKPGLYTDVIKLVFDIYMRRVCRAQKQTEQEARPWGKPVSAGCHVNGCLWARSSRLQVEQAHDWERKGGRALRRRYPQNEDSSIVIKHRKYDDEEDEDFEVKLPQTLKQDMDWYKRVEGQKQKHEVHEMSGVATVAGRKQNQCHVIDEVNEDLVSSEEDGNESDDWIPVKVTRGSEKRNQAVASRKQTGSRLMKNRKREHGDHADSDSVTLSKKIAGASASRKGKQANSSRMEVDMSVDRCEFESMLKGGVAPVQQKYVWSDEEEEVVTCQVGSGDASVKGNHTVLSVRANKQSLGTHVKVGRVDVLDRTAENLNTDVVKEELSKHQSESDKTVAGPMVEVGNCKQAAGNSQETSSHGKLDALIVDVSSSQSCESLLDGQGNLYSTQLSSSAHNTDSHLASTSSVQRSRQQGQNTSKVRNLASSRQAGQPSVGRKSDIKSQKDEKLSVGQASQPEDQGSSDFIFRPSLKQKNMRNSIRNKEASDDRSQMKVVNNQVNDKVVMKDNNCDIKQDPKPLSSNRCLKRYPVALIQEEKRRKLDNSSLLNKSNSYAVSETCSTKISAESSFDCGGHPLPPTPGRPELSQDAATSVADSTCPICGQYFHPSKLEAHASSCGEDIEISADGDSDDEIRCLKCAEKIPKENIKEHQTHCVNIDVPVRRLTRSNRE